MTDNYNCDRPILKLIHDFYENKKLCWAFSQLSGTQVTVNSFVVVKALKMEALQNLNFLFVLVKHFIF